MRVNLSQLTYYLCYNFNTYIFRFSNLCNSSIFLVDSNHALSRRMIMISSHHHLNLSFKFFFFNSNDYLFKFCWIIGSDSSKMNCKETHSASLLLLISSIPLNGLILSLFYFNNSFYIKKTTKHLINSVESCFCILLIFDLNKEDF